MTTSLPVPSMHSVAFRLEDRPLDRQDIISALPASELPVQSRVVRISTKLVVKYGTEVQMEEARNMQFVASVAHVRASRVHDAWRQDEAGRGRSSEKRLDVGEATYTYILMEYVHGNVLGDIWSYLGETRQTAIVREIYDMVKSLHRCVLSSPGPVGGGKSKGFYFTCNNAGPFQSQRDMELWFNNRLKVGQQFRRAPLNQASFVDCLHPLVMCHMDLHSHNVIIDDEGCPWLLDWEHAGGYSYWFEEAFLNFDNGCKGFTDALEALLQTPESLDMVARIKTLNFAVTTARNVEPRGD